MTPQDQIKLDERAAHEESVLKQYGLRWAVLAGWRDALHLRQVPLPGDLDRLLECARVKIASGCFSICEVGCDLGQLEATMTSIDASTNHNWVDFWVDMLGYAMAENAETERILKVPAVKTRYVNCGVSACHC